MFGTTKQTTGSKLGFLCSIIRLDSDSVFVAEAAEALYLQNRAEPGVGGAGLQSKGGAVWEVKGARCGGKCGWVAIDVEWKFWVKNSLGLENLVFGVWGSGFGGWG